MYTRCLLAGTWLGILDVHDERADRQAAVGMGKDGAPKRSARDLKDRRRRSKLDALLKEFQETEEEEEEEESDGDGNGGGPSGFFGPPGGPPPPGAGAAAIVVS
jgi:hypothetical protein